MTKIIAFFFFLLLTIFLNSCSKATSSIAACTDTTQLQACFTPGEDCTHMLINSIDASQQSIYVQAYSFTSYPIAKALVRAEGRGVNVFIIVDKVDVDPSYFSVIPYLRQHHIPLWIDNQVVIAHNKVMIFDQSSVETGSFNFTRAAQNNNAENMLIIHNPEIAAVYLHNWQARKKISKIFS